jgi:hypothetical protein
MKPNGRQTALYPGNEDRVGFWLTPPDLMAQLQAEFDFDCDACPYPRPAGFDGLKEPWGKRTYVNPPYHGKDRGLTKWVRKADSERNQGKTVVMIMPVNTWMEEAIRLGAEFRAMGRVRWQGPDGSFAPRGWWPVALFILRPKP